MRIISKTIVKLDHSLIARDFKLELEELSSKTAYMDSRYLHYFPMLYLLPERYFKNKSWVEGFPRNPHHVMESEYWSHVFDSDQMQQLIMEAYSEAIWPYVGLRGQKEEYSWACLGYRICYRKNWMLYTLKALGYTLEYVLDFTKENHIGIQFHSEEEFQKIMSIAVPSMFHIYKIYPMLIVDRETRCIEDFDHSKHSYVQKDFYRKWYHIRSRHAMTSLDTLITKDGERHPMDFPDPQQDFEEKSLSKAVFEIFKERISPKDMQILKLRVAGYTYEEIAQKLGYKNHSGVLKRIRKIASQYKDFNQRYGT